MALYVIDDRYNFDNGYYNGNLPPYSAGVLWKIKDDQCQNKIINEYWLDKSKNYSICATRSNNLINPITDRLNGFPVAICSDSKGNIYVYASLDKTIQKIDINNNLSTVFTWPKFLDDKNNKDVGGFVNGKLYTAVDPVRYTSVSSLAVDNDENIYVSLQGSYAIYKIDKNKNISKLCGQPSDTFLGPNEAASINWNIIPYKDGDKNSAVFQGGNEGPFRLKFFNNYLYVLDNREYQLRRIDLNGNVKTLLAGNSQIIDYAITKNNILYIIHADYKLKKIDLNTILNSSDPKVIARELENNSSYRINVIKEYSTFGPDNGGQIFSFGEVITLDDREENLYISQRDPRYGDRPIIYKINLFTDQNNPTIKAIAFAGENSFKRQGSINPGQGIDIRTRDFNRNINITFRTDKPEIISNLNLKGKMNEYLEYKIIAEGLPQRYFVTGTLPVGLEFDSQTNKILGVANSVGKFQVLLRVEKTNENGVILSDTKILTIEISPKIISGLEITRAFNTSIDYTISAEGIVNAYEAKLTNNQPISSLGLIINNATGQIAGNINQGGIFEIEISASYDGIKDVKILKLYVLKITSPTTLTAETGATFYYEITTNGEPTDFQILESLPNGLSLNTSGLVKAIVGTLNEDPGQVLNPFTISISKNGVSYSQTLTISVGIRITNTELSKTLRHNQNFEYLIETNYGENIEFENVFTSVIGLPLGLTFSPSTYIISGTITNTNISGKFTCFIFASKNGITTQKQLIINIPPFIIYDGLRVDSIVGEYFSYKINAPGALNFAARNLPSDLKIDQFSGEIYGIPIRRSLGQRTVEIIVDGNGGQTKKDFVFFVGPNFIIKINDKTTKNNFFNKGNQKCYYINNKEAPVLYIEKGKEYVFDQTDVSNGSNPLNIYYDVYKSKKLNQYITIEGTEGFNRKITINIPKSFKETQTLYYMSENSDFVGGEIKLISKDYKLKHNIKLLCFGARHDGQRYIIPNRIITENSFKINGDNSFIQNEVGVLAILSTPTGGNIFSSNYINRKDTLSVNLVKSDGGIELDKFDLNYFGNTLTYNAYPTGDNEYSNMKELYDKIVDLSFGSSGVMDIYPGLGSLNSYKFPGYQLDYCQGCIQNVNLITGEFNPYSGKIEIFYDPVKLINDYTANKYLNIKQDEIKTGDFIFFDSSLRDNFKYEKSFSSDTVYNISRKI